MTTDDERDIKESNTLKFKRNSQKIKHGHRSPSPDYRLIGKLEKRYANKLDVSEDYSIHTFTSVKLQMKTKDNTY